jgi:hypothetical protein
MSKYQGVKRIFLSVSFSLIIAFGLLIQVNCAEAGGIGPNQGFDSVVVLGDQSKSITTTQAAPFGTHGVFFLSIDNVSVDATIRFTTATATGLWTLTTITLGSMIPIDMVWGLIPLSGKKTRNDVPAIGVGLTIGNVYLTSPVDAANPVQYSINVQGNKP